MVERMTNQIEKFAQEMQSRTWSDVMMYANHGDDEQTQAAQREAARRVKKAKGILRQNDDEFLRRMTRNDLSPGEMADLTTNLQRRAGVEARAELIRRFSQDILDEREHQRDHQRVQQVRQAQTAVENSEGLRSLALAASGVVGLLALLALLSPAQEDGDDDRADQEGEEVVEDDMEPIELETLGELDA